MQALAVDGILPDRRPRRRGGTSAVEDRAGGALVLVGPAPHMRSQRACSFGATLFEERQRRGRSLRTATSGPSRHALTAALRERLTEERFAGGL